MAEIGSTSSITPWPTSGVVHSTGDAKHSPKRQQNSNQGQENEQQDKTNSKKKPPDSDVNEHIDEYA